MTLEELKKLEAGQSVSYKPPGRPAVDCLVLQNGPRLDADGEPLAFLQPILMIQLGTSSTRVTWEPDAFPQGIEELKATDNPPPEQFKDPVQPEPLPPRAEPGDPGIASTDYPHPDLPTPPTP